jgi:hypothetical protein
LASTSEPFARLVKKLSSAVRAELISPELNADPIELSRPEKEESLEDEVEDVLSDDVSVVELVEELLDELSSEIRLVRLS